VKVLAIHLACQSNSRGHGRGHRPDNRAGTYVTQLGDLRLQGGAMSYAKEKAGSRPGFPSSKRLSNSVLVFPLFFAHNGKWGIDMALTKRQKQVMDLIDGLVRENGYSPSYEEIARGLGLASLATVHKHISALEAKNYLRRGFNQSRSLEVGQKYVQEMRRNRMESATSLEIPLVGRIAAGAPVEAIEQRSTLNFQDFVGNPDTFALEVRGDSMIEDHICDGDLILLEKVSEAHDGDIVVALLSSSETTLKRLYREPGDKIRLQPANSALKPIIVPASDVRIQGRLLAVLRKYK
jgi:repressor LexA